MKITDESSDDQMLTSNSVLIKTSFKKESFDHLLRVLSEDDYTTDAKLFAEQWVRYFYPSFQKEFSSLNHEKRTELTSNASVWWQAEHQNPFIQEKMDMVNKTGSITE